MKVPSIPSIIPKRYHNETKALLEQFQRDIFYEILKDGDLDDKAFLGVIKFWEDMNKCPSSVLKINYGKKGNEVSTRLYDLRHKIKGNKSLGSP